MFKLEITISTQKLIVLRDNVKVKEYSISTGKNGAGEENGSGKTPRGRHLVRAKIGENAAPNTVFVGRRPTGEIYDLELRKKFPERDWILTRIFWLSGLDVGRNRLGSVDTMQRYVYIHGTPDDVELGKPGSKGCIRMRNKEIIELFDLVPVGTPVLISE